MLASQYNLVNFVPNLVFPQIISDIPMANNFFNFSFDQGHNNSQDEQQKIIEREQRMVSDLLRIAIEQQQAAMAKVNETPTTAQSASRKSSGASTSQQKAFQRPHQCDECGKKFRFHSNLVEHRTVHFDGCDHYFACPLCPKKCRLKGNLKKHLHRHYSTQDEVDQAWQVLYGGHTRRIRRENSLTSHFSV
ncbi:hypothetical protein FO519_004768 [Halicephalobus sp. NKZ332]|nr:hypothetical protein FO519_004768 [Halicephalobus sp. NKZ332]